MYVALSGAAWRGPLQQRGELGEALGRRVGAVEAGGPLQFADRGVEGGIGLVRRAEILQAAVEADVALLLELGEEARLADAGLAGDEHDLAGARQGPRPAAAQEVHLLPAAHQLQHAGSAQRFESPRAGAFAGHLPHGHRREVVCQHERLHLPAVEELADQPAGAAGDEHAVRRRGRLQPQGEIEGLAGRGNLARRRRRCADHHHSRGDPDVRAERAGSVDGAHGIDQFEPCPDRALRVVLLRPLVSEIDRHAVAQGLRDEAAEALGDIGAGAVNRTHQLCLVLGAEPGRYGGQAADPARQDAQLPQLARARRVVCLLGRRRDRRRARPFDLFDAGGELVAHARQGEDEARAIGIRLDLAPQPGHQHVDAAFVGVMVAARDAVAQLIARQHAAAAARQQRQQPELGAREGDLPPVLVHEGMAGEIERASLEAQDRCRSCGFAGLRRCDPRQERCEPLLVQRRREKCVCIRNEAGQRGEGGALFGDDDDPAAAGAQFSSQRDACFPARRGRHDGGSQPTRVRRRLRVSPGQRHGVAQRLNHVSQSRAKRGLFGRNQNAHLHARLPRPEPPDLSR